MTRLRETGRHIEQPQNPQTVRDSWNNLRQAQDRGGILPAHMRQLQLRFYTDLEKYFSQKSVRTRKSEESASLVRELFSPDNPFATRFTEAVGNDSRLLAERARHESETVSDMVYHMPGYDDPAKHIWEDQVGVILEHTRQAAGKLALTINAENRARKDLYKLAHTDETSYQQSTETEQLAYPENPALRERIQGVILAAVPEATQPITQAIKIARDLVDTNEATGVDERLEVLPEPVYRQLATDPRRRNNDVLRAQLNELQSPARLWELATHATDPDTGELYIPAAVSDAMGDLMIMSSLVETLSAIKHKSIQQRAEALLPFLKMGVEASHLLEYTKHAATLSEQDLAQQIEILINEHEDVPTAQNGNRKIISKIAQGIAVAAIIATYGAGILSAVHFPDTSHATHKTVTVELPPVPTPSQQTPDSTQPQPNTPVSSNSPDIPGQADVGEFIGAGKVAVWNVEGNNASGYYVLQTTYDWDPQMQAWIPVQNPNTVVSLDQIPTATQKDLNFTGTFVLNDGSDGTFVTIPFRDGYLLSSPGFQLTFTDDQGNVMPAENYQILQGAGGYYFLKIGQGTYNQGEKVKISFSLGKADTSQLFNPSQAATNTELQARISTYDLNQLPPDLQALLQSIQGKSQAEQADALTSYIQTQFTYTLDNRWADYYHSGLDSNTFFIRMFNAKRGDCDIAGTALLDLLRMEGIPSYGEIVYWDQGSNKITEQDRHFVVRAYIDGQWKTFDPTPTNMDDYTRNALKKAGVNLGGNGQSTDGKGNSQGKQNGNEQGGTGNSKKIGTGSDPNAQALSQFEQEEFFREIPRSLEISLGIVGLMELIGLGAAGAVRLREKGHTKLADDMIEELKIASRAYAPNVNEAIIDSLIADEVEYVNQNKPGDHGPADIIPPVAIWRLIRDRRRQAHLESMHIEQPHQASGTPGSVDFRVSVANREQTTAEEQITSDEISRTMNEFNWTLRGGVVDFIRAFQSPSVRRGHEVNEHDFKRDLTKIILTMASGELTEDWEQQLTDSIYEAFNRRNRYRSGKDTQKDEQRRSSFNRTLERHPNLLQTTAATMLWMRMVSEATGQEPKAVMRKNN